MSISEVCAKLAGGLAPDQQPRQACFHDPDRLELSTKKLLQASKDRRSEAQAKRRGPAAMQVRSVQRSMEREIVRHRVSERPSDDDDLHLGRKYGGREPLRPGLPAKKAEKAMAALRRAGNLAEIDLPQARESQPPALPDSAATRAKHGAPATAHDHEKTAAEPAANAAAGKPASKPTAVAPIRRPVQQREAKPLARKTRSANRESSEQQNQAKPPDLALLEAEAIELLAQGNTAQRTVNAASSVAVGKKALDSLPSSYPPPKVPGLLK